MQPSPKTRPRVNVVWFKCTDLRTHDHAALKNVHDGKLPVLHLFVFDPRWYETKTPLGGFPKTGSIRTQFQVEAVADLQDRLAKHGHVLNIRSHISTSACFEELCEDYSINAVFAFREVCSEEQRVENRVREVLRRKLQGGLQLFWGFELYHGDDLNFDPVRTGGAYRSYTAFRKRVECCQVRSSSREDPDFTRNSSVQWQRADTVLPTLQGVMGTNYTEVEVVADSRAEFRWIGGETAALRRLESYLWEEDNLAFDYVGATMTTDPAKSCMRDKSMSKFSPWLAHGCLSPRRLFEEVKRYEKERYKNKSTYWITHELVWRDFVRFGSLHAGTSIFKIGGPDNVRPAWRWSSDKQLFSAWCDGRTGFPFIDCFMRELRSTGYCNHMGRECAGWFLIGDIGLDWRMGAEWFESVLIDYEPTANWYNWTYRCLPAVKDVAAPGERLRGLQVLRWGTQHDPSAEYIKRWVPELAALPPIIAREPWRLGLNDNTQSANQDLRPLPSSGRFDVDQTGLAMLVSMGFDQSDAAIALYRAWGDTETAVAVLTGEYEGEAAPIPEEHGGFKYGIDYPKPIIAPVSFNNTEAMQEEASVAQAKRDSQNARERERLRRASVGSSRRPAFQDDSWRKDRWEESKKWRKAETPTGAKVAAKPAEGRQEDVRMEQSHFEPQSRVGRHSEPAGTEDVPMTDKGRNRRWNGRRTLEGG